MKTKAFLLLLFVIACGQSYGQETRQIDNAAAFAKLYGYVRYFHPSDEAAAIDWERFAIYGNKKVENCKSPQELQATLTALFQPIAPTVAVYLENEDVAFNVARITPSEAKKYKTIAWQHNGLGMGDSRNAYQSARTNRAVSYKSAKSSARKFGPVSTMQDATAYRGKEFILRGRVKLVNGSGTAHLWARVDNAANKTIFLDNMSDRPVRSNEWAHYEIKGEIDAEASKIYVGAFLAGAGELWLDDISLKVNDNGTWKEIYTEQFTDERTGKTSRRLSSGDSGRSQKESSGYLYTIVQQDNSQDDKWLSIKSEAAAAGKKKKPKLLFKTHAQPGEYTAKTIGGGLKATIPLALYGTDQHTYPAAEKAALMQLQKELEEIPASDVNGSNLYTRLGDITITWNVFQHFYPYFAIVGTDWHQDLRDALTKAYTDSTAVDFQKNLQKLTAKLQDGHVRVFSYENKATHLPPVSWEWIEDKLVITEVLDSSVSLSKGDIVTTIDGATPEAFFADVHQHISAATKGWLDYRAQTESLLGEKDSELHLTILKADNTTADVQLKRTFTRHQMIAAQAVQENIKALAEGITYVNISEASMKQIKEAMPKLQQSKAIICDLRGYPNGNHGLIQYLLPAKDTSKQWMQVANMIYPDQERVVDYRKVGWRLKPKKPHLDARIIFLTDGRAISYAESYMSFIEHYKLATIVGQPTAGTNGNVNTFALPGGYNISWTGMKVQKHDGTQHHGVGIQPHVYVEKTIQGVRENRDEFLEKAIEVASAAH